jgi:DNA-binding transcriptional regulator YiaG
MSNPNRSKNPTKPGREPRPHELVAAREAAGLTQEQAAALVYTSVLKLQQWESGEALRGMPASSYELLLIKTGQYEDLGYGHWRLANGVVIEVHKARREYL